MLWLIRIVCAGAMMWVTMPSSQAQVARVAKVQRTVEVRDAAAWRRTREGASLNVGNRLRTGKRSKADLKFADGSLIRLGALSSIELQSLRGVRLSSGQILFSALNPLRILAGTGTAEIRGSVGVISLLPDGSADFSLFSGAMDVTAGGQTVTVPPGRRVRAAPDGTLSASRTVTPFGFVGGVYHPELLSEPEDTPFAGSTINETVRDAPGRRALDQIVPQLQPVLDGGTVYREAEPGFPFPSPFPPGVALRAAQKAMQSRAVKDVTARWVQVAPIQSTLQDTSAADTAVTDVAVADVAFDLDTRAALDHLDEVDRGIGRALGGEASLVAALGDGGAAVYGARLRGSGASGKLYAEGTLLPLRLRTSNGSRDFSSLADAFVTYRDTWGEVQAGRQRFVAGPTQAALFGSLVRQGGRETMDAIRFAPRLRSGQQLELAYIYDAFPRNLPFQIGGAQKALYGRAALHREGFNAGVNAFKYTSAPVANTTGLTLDFAVPLLRDDVELYGEVGRDAFRRRLTTVGLSFPGLYQRTDFDAFLEYAKLQNSSLLSTPPSEVTLRVYRRFGDHLNTVAALSHFGGGAGWNFRVGIALGARSGGQRDQ
jgi:hypothetical protein